MSVSVLGKQKDKIEEQSQYLNGEKKLLTGHNLMTADNVICLWR